MADMSTPIKGEEFSLGFSLYRTNGIIPNPGTLTAKISPDFGPWVDMDGSVSVVDETYGQLLAVFDTVDTACDVLMFYCVDDTPGCIPYTATIYFAASPGLAVMLDEVRGKVSLIGSGATMVQASVAPTGDIEIRMADDYPASLGRQIPLTIADPTHVLDLENAQHVILKARGAGWEHTSATRTDEGYLVEWEPSKEDTVKLTPGVTTYEIEIVTASGKVVTRPGGTLTAVRDAEGWVDG